jgi:hypothetical protein
MVARVLRLAVTTLVAIVAAAPAAAESSAARTVELLVCRAELVAIGRAVSVDIIAGQGQLLFRRYRFAASEMIKGEREQCHEFTVVGSRDQDNPTTHVPLDRDLLVFLSRSEYSDEGLKGRFVATSTGQPFSIVCLERPGRYLIDRDRNLLSRGEQVLEATYRASRDYEQYHAEHPDTEIKERRVEITDGEAYQELWAGSECALLLPDFLVDDSSVSPTPRPN